MCLTSTQGSSIPMNLMCLTSTQARIFCIYIYSFLVGRLQKEEALQVCVNKASELVCVRLKVLCVCVCVCGELLN